MTDDDSPSASTDGSAELEDAPTTLSQETLERARKVGPPRASLLVYDRDSIRVVPLDQGAPVVLGRASPADVVVDHPSLSRQHARFTWVAQGLRVEDLGSTNGAHLRGARVSEALLAPGETLSLGAVMLSWNLASSGLLEGVESYERFFARVSDELLRGRAFRRGVALAMIRAIGTENAHVSRWAPRLSASLRPVDRMALWGESAVLVLLPECEAARARAVVSAMVDGDRLGEPTLVSGVALAGASAGELVDRARTLCRGAKPRARVVLDDEVALTTATDTPVFASPAMRALRDLVDKVAASNLPILVRGETGSGKEVVARAIHEASPRSEHLIRSVNCAAMPATLLESLLFGHERGAFTGADRTTPGLFEQAHRGTLFLDEVGELSPAAQAALLRVLETRRLMRVGGVEEIPVDVRVIAATHRDLDEMVGRGTFRQDLLYRLNTVSIDIPPLRERREDLTALIDRFFGEAVRAGGGRVRAIEPGARALLEGHEWPGNVRELRNVIERAVVICAGDEVTVADLPQALRAPAARSKKSAELPPDPDGDFRERVKTFETQLILDALARTSGNQTKAAELLRMPLRTMFHKMKAYGIRKHFDSE